MTSEAPPPRYCALCGEDFRAPAIVCPNCGETWAEPFLRRDLPTTAAVLSTIQRWVSEGLVSPEAAAPLRARYEEQLRRLHGRAEPEPERAPEPTLEPAPAPAPAPAPRVATASTTPALATAGAPMAATPAARSARVAPTAPRRQPPSRPPFDVQAWVARRQADILLYLGAFLLVVSALIFVARQEGELATGWRVGLLAAYTVGFLAAGLLLRRWPRVREAGPVFLAIGALFTPLNFVLIYTEVLQDRGVEASAVWFAGASYSTVFYGVLFRQRFGRLYAIPAALALHVAWGALFVVLDLPSEWFWPWWMAFAVAATVALWESRTRQPLAMVHPVVIGGLAFLLAHSVLSRSAELQNGPLPATYALLTLGVTYYGYARRELLTPIAAAIGVAATGVTTLWAFGFEADWYAYPALAVAGVIAVSHDRWATNDPRLARSAWLLVIAAALIPVLSSDAFTDGGAHGVVASAAAALLLATLAWRNVEYGLLAESWSVRTPTLLGERFAAGWAAFVMAIIAIAYAQRELGIERPDLGWAYLVVGALTAVTMALEGRRDVRAFAATLPPFALTIAVSLQAWDRYPGHDAIYLGVPAAELLLVFAWTRRWSITLAAAGLAIGAAAAAWEALEWEFWTLALAYGGAGLALLAGLATRRAYRPAFDRGDEESLSAILLSWGVLLAAPVTAWIALDLRAEPGFDPPSTIEYRVLVGIVAAVGVLLSLEGWRLRRWDVQVPALAIVAGALGAAWPAASFETWTLGPVYLLAAALLLAVLTSRRSYADTYDSAVIVALSWGLAPAAIVAASIALGLRAEPGYDAPATIEYRTLVAVVAAVGVLIAAEGRRLRHWDVQIPALAVGIGSLGAAWPAFGFETWTLGPVYGVMGAGVLIGLAPRRSYTANSFDADVMIVLSWALPVAAAAAATIALALRAEPDFDAPSTIEYRVLVAIVAAIGAMLAAEGWRVRGWEWQVAAAALLAGAVGAAWPAAEFEPWTLGPTYAIAGAVLFVALGSRREYRTSDSRSVSLQLLSWGLLALGVAIAWNTLTTQLTDGPREAVRLVEFRALISTVVIFAPLLAYEAWRLPERSLYVVAGAVLVTSIEMVIATFEPSNVQAYTVPAALYAAGVSLVIRRSPMLIEPHLQWHEGVTIVGAALLVLPQAEQGFEPGGQGWALVLLIEGALFLGLSFALTARWLAVAGVMTMSGVALRALAVNRDAVPYWVMLGAAGLLLLAAGFVLLLQRDWWDRARRGLSDWWTLRAVVAATPADIHLLALLSALAPAIAAAVLPLDR